MLFLLDVLPDVRAIEQPVDAGGFFERLVFAEAQVWRVSEVQSLRDLGADVFLIALKR